MDAERKRMCARKQPCGCMVAAISYEPDGAAWAAKDIARWIALGYKDDMKYARLLAIAADLESEK